jgi:hypothetical protein
VVLVPELRRAVDLVKSLPEIRIGMAVDVHVFPGAPRELQAWSGAVHQSILASRRKTHSFVRAVTLETDFHPFRRSFPRLAHPYPVATGHNYGESGTGQANRY